MGLCVSRASRRLSTLSEYTSTTGQRTSTHLGHIQVKPSNIPYGHLLRANIKVQPRERECDNLPPRRRAASCLQRRRAWLRMSSSRPEGSPRPCHHPGKQGCQYTNTPWHLAYLPAGLVIFTRAAPEPMDALGVAGWHCRNIPPQWRREPPDGASPLTMPMLHRT